MIGSGPAEFRVSRSATIAAPPDAVFSQINNLHRYAQWNPWESAQWPVKLSAERNGSQLHLCAFGFHNRHFVDGPLPVVGSPLPNLLVALEMP